MDFNEPLSLRSNPSVPAPMPLVCVVDDDISVRESLQSLIRSAGWLAETFASAEEYLARQSDVIPSCLILDVRLPDMDGFGLQQQIAEECPPPIIFLTGLGEVASSVRAIKAGALDYLTKPFCDDALLALLHAALAQDAERRARQGQQEQLRQRFRTLTPREREVMPLVVSGLLNKQTAWELGISEVTAQVHRARIMKKMKAGSFADLVRMAAALDIPAHLARRHNFRTTEDRASATNSSSSFASEGA